MRPLAALALLLLAAIAIRRRIRHVGAAISVDDTDWLHAACDPWTERMASNA